MRVDDLIGYGLPPQLISQWRGDGLSYLLPIQEAAIRQYGLLDNRDLLICGPTSSGKTFCGELAALKAIQNKRKAIILVPLKAIADEKYARFYHLYKRLGLKILIVSGDFPEHKKRFLKGDYDLAVVVYEMLNSLTASNLSALEPVGAVVFDEFQIITSADRGLIYEAVLAKVRYFRGKIQFVGLIGGLTDCQLFERWLNLPLLYATNRPVELHRGVLCDGKFAYKRYNDCYEGIEYFAAGNDSIDSECLPEQLYRAIKFLTDNNEQALIFVARRFDSVRLAMAFAQVFNLPPAEQAMAALGDLPDTMQKLDLLDCLNRGVAFHNADLSLAYRQALEQGYRGGAIRIMVCTSTLALGVNLPSKNVFIEPEKYYDSVSGSPALKSLQIDDYNQIAGRAGRLGQGDSFGRAVIIAADENQSEQIRRYFLNSPAAAKPILFDLEKLAFLSLCWISCGMLRDYNDARDLLKSTLRGYIENFQTNLPTRIIDYLNMHGFITLKGCRLICTDLGQTAVAHNLELNTAAAVKDGFVKYKLADNFLSWLYYILDIPECRRNLLHRRYFNFEMPVIEYIKSLLAGKGERPLGALNSLLENPDPNHDPSRVNTLMFLADIIQPIAGIELENKYQTGWGRLKRTAEFYSNIMLAVAAIGRVNGLTKDQYNGLSQLADCLHHGLPESGLALARLNIPLLERDFILRLLDHDLKCPSAIASCELDMLNALLPEKIARNLYERCRQIADHPETEPTVLSPLTKPPLKASREGARYLVEFAGHTISLQPRLYKYLYKLYNAASDGWLDKNLLDRGLNQVKYIYKLRQALETIEGITIEADGAGRYRLVIAEKKAEQIETVG